MPRKARHAAGGDTPNHDKMTDNERHEIVTRLAMYDTATSIREDLLARGIDISLQGICHYQPRAGHRMAKKWVDLFSATRQQWLAAQAAEPIANRNFRLRRLGLIHEKAMRRGDLARAQSALEQAAKEVGNVFSNVQKVHATQAPGQANADMTPEERRNMLADRVAEALAARSKPAKRDATKH